MSSIISDPLLIAVIILSVVVIVLLVITIMMNIKLRKFLIGIDSDHIGDSLEFAENNIKELQKFKTPFVKRSLWSKIKSFFIRQVNY